MVLLQRGASSKVGGMVFASARCLLQGWRNGVCRSAAPPPRLEGWFCASARLSRKGAFAPARHLLQGWGMVLRQRGVSSKVGGMVALQRAKIREMVLCFSAVPPPRLEGWCLPQPGASSKVGGIVCLRAVPPPRLERWFLHQRGVSSQVGRIVLCFSAHKSEGRSGRSAALPPRLEGWCLPQRGVSSKVGGVVSPQRAIFGEMVLLQRAASSKVGGTVFASVRCILQGWRDGVCLSAVPPPRLEGWCLPQRGASSKVGEMSFASARRILQGWRDGSVLQRA